MLLHDVAIGRLGIFHQRAAAVAVDIDHHKAAVEPGHTQRAQECVGRLLALEAGIIAGAVARLVNLVERSRAEERIIVGKYPFVMAEIAVRRIKALVVGAAGEASLGVVDDTVAADDGAIVALVAQIG